MTLEYTFKNDTLFKMLYMQYPDLLKSLLATLLGVQADSIEHFELTDPDTASETHGEKFCRLGINMSAENELPTLHDRKFIEEESMQLSTYDSPVMKQATKAYQKIMAEDRYQTLERVHAPVHFPPDEWGNKAGDLESIRRSAYREAIDKLQDILAEQASRIANKDSEIALLHAMIDDK